MRVHAELFRSSTFLVVTLLLAASLVSAEKPEAAAMSKTRIVLLGTGNPAPLPDRSGPATAIVVNDTAYLIDFGPGVACRSRCCEPRYKGARSDTSAGRVRYPSSLRSHSRLP